MNTLNIESSLLDSRIEIDVEKEVNRIVEAIENQVYYDLNRTGVVLGISGGIDSSVCAALCVRALGKDRVVGLMTPEQDSSPKTLEHSKLIAEQLGIKTIYKDITPVVNALGGYEHRDEAIRKVIPGYNTSYKSKLISDNILSDNRKGYSLKVCSPEGVYTEVEISPDILRAIVAATNSKQRARKMMEYYYADVFHYAVVGTPNRLEYELGFFVKNGDGSADLKPIAHLYKTQVYQIAEYLRIPDPIRNAVPTTDTYSLEQTQEEFYFAMHLLTLDKLLMAKNQGIPVEDLTKLGLSVEQLKAVYDDLDLKKIISEYHRMPALMVDQI
jgi:NAD+ synthase